VDRGIGLAQRLLQLVPALAVVVVRFVAGAAGGTRAGELRRRHCDAERGDRSA
jgi:hypothetical protein